MLIMLCSMGGGLPWCKAVMSLQTADPQKEQEKWEDRRQGEQEQYVVRLGSSPSTGEISTERHSRNAISRSLVQPSSSSGRKPDDTLILRPADTLPFQAGLSLLHTHQNAQLGSLAQLMSAAARLGAH